MNNTILLRERNYNSQDGPGEFLIKRDDYRLLADRDMKVDDLPVFMIAGPSQSLKVDDYETVEVELVDNRP